MNNIKKVKMEYRELFVKFVREDCIVRIYLDLNYIDSFATEAKTQDDFEKDCKEYIATGLLEKAKKRWFGK